MDAATCTDASAFRLSLVIPAWNEEQVILQAINEASAALERTTADFEIVVVDDGSTDRTAEIVEQAARSHPHVRLIRQPRNLGYGAALRAGFQAASMELVAFTDADCQFDLNELAYMLPLTRQYDITCGYRIDRQDPVRRRFFSWGYNTLVKLLIGSPVHDLDCALKIFRREHLSDIMPECDNFFVNTEMLTRARQQNLSVVEVGVHHRPRAAGKSKVSLWDIPRTLSMLLPFWWSRVLFSAHGRDREQPDCWNAVGMMIVALVAGLLLFLNLSYPLVKPDEHRYAEIGREMLMSGDWIVPRLNQQPYLDKPPLYYWLTCISYLLFGVTEQAARYVPALSAFLTILATYYFGTRSLGNRAGLFAALALTLTTGFIQCGRFIILDSQFTLFTTLALFTGHEAIRHTRLRWRWWIASALCCTLGVLTKGPAALILVVPPMLAYLWLNGRANRRLVGLLFVYSSLVLALVAPWYIAMTVRIPEFAYYFFVEHNLLRFLTGRFHEAPVWFYLPVLIIGGLPWSLLAVPLTKYLFARSPQMRALRERALGFPLLWAGWCLIFFSLSRGKLPPYILPALPALALIVGSYLNHILSQASLRALFHEELNRTPRHLVMLFASAWIFVAGFCWWRSLIGTTEYLVEVGVCVTCLVGVHLWGRTLPAKVAWALSCLVAAAVIYECSHELVPDWSRQRSPLAHAEVYGLLLQDPTVGVAAYGHEWCTLPLQEEHNEIFNFSHKSPPELRKHLSQHNRNLLVTKTTRNCVDLRWAVPKGMKIRRVADHGETRVFVVEDNGND